MRTAIGHFQRQGGAWTGVEMRCFDPAVFFEDALTQFI
jgi:hypothetical protein